MKTFADKLLDAIDKKQNISCVGLDPDIKKIPEFLKAEAMALFGDTFEAVGYAFTQFNKGIIAKVHDLAAVVKPQMAFYEKYMIPGIIAFKATVDYAKSFGLLVIEDAKRNDIKNTAKQYSDGHIGRVELCSGRKVPALDVDALTVNGYLGTDGVAPFVEDVKAYQKGIFILDKTSNPSSGDLQDLVLKESDLKVSEKMAQLIDKWGEGTEGERGYKSVGAVVGVTYGKDGAAFRKWMPKSILLMPGYGSQGGKAEDIIPCLNPDGYGAIVNNSSGINYAWMNDKDNPLGPMDFGGSARKATLAMKKDINFALKNAGLLKW
jgi:orotidine-5'-phosphate decarboxylase